MFNFSLAAFWTQHFQSTIHLENGKTRFIGNPGLVCIFGVEHRSPKNFAAWRVSKETFQHTDGYQLQEPEFKQRCQINKKLNWNISMLLSRAYWIHWLYNCLEHSRLQALILQLSLTEVAPKGQLVVFLNSAHLGQKHMSTWMP